jgi:3-methylcrotonyl-CoA carboxylase alpha subunit
VQHRQGDTITPYYDPLIAKIVAWGPDRESAAQTMLAALEASRVEGPHTNLAFLRALVRHPAFRAGRLDTGFIDRERATLLG